MRNLLFCVLLLGIVEGFAFDESVLNPTNDAFGPNSGVSVEVASPLVNGTWIPQALGRYGFLWVEPLGSDRLGDGVRPDSRFLRFSMDGELSPLFGMMQAMLGFRVIPHFEFALSYQFIGFLGSNVELAVPGNTQGATLGQTWRSDYLFPNLYKNNGWDYAQTFAVWLGSDWSLGQWHSGIEYHHVLVDESGNFRGKSIDYSEALPVNRKDFFFDVMVWTKHPLTKRLDFSFDGEYQQTGFLTSLMGHYDKEAVQQMIAYSGVNLHLGQGSSELKLQPGFFWRSQKYLTGSWSEQILLRVSWTSRIPILFR